MTLSMLALRILTMCFNVYISALLGAELIGLYHLIFSAFTFAITFSVSGTSFCATRLVSESKNAGCENAVVYRCTLVSLVTSTLAVVLLNVFSGGIALNILGDIRCQVPLKIMSLGLPVIAVSAVFRGYMVAKGHIALLSISQILEEGVSIAVSIGLITVFKNSNKHYVFVIIGLVISQYTAFFTDVIIYKLKKEKNITKSSAGYKSILSISVPLAFGSYLRSGLCTIENILIPQRLRAFGFSDALAKYGIVKGMSMPVMLFPAVLISSCASLLMPELARKNSLGMKNGIKYISSKAFEGVLIFSTGVAFCIFYFSDSLAISLYKNYEAGIYLCLLAFLTVPMYVDTICDSMLKGLNKQVASLKINIVDSVLRVAMIFYILPIYGVKGYIWVLYISEIFNLSLSLWCLSDSVRIEINLFKSAVLPIVFAIISGYIADRYINNLIFAVFGFTLMYMIMLYICEKVAKYVENKRKI